LHPDFFGGEGFPKFWTGITKSNTLPNMVQNFAAINRWSSEILQLEKNNKRQQKVSPLQKLSFPSGLKDLHKIHKMENKLSKN